MGGSSGGYGGGYYGGYYGGYWGGGYYYGGPYGYPYYSYWGPMGSYYYYPWGYFYPFDTYAYGGIFGAPYVGAAPVYREQVTRTAAGGVRVQVNPQDTEVYLDGGFAGVADDFDGMTQSLRVSPGAHDIALKHAGRETHKVRVYVGPDQSLKIRHDMKKGDPRVETNDEIGDPRAVPEKSEPPGRGVVSAATPGGKVTLRLSVQPEDASIYVDGAFQGMARSTQTVDLVPGRHKLEIVRPGFKTIERELELGPADTPHVAVSLEN
jgi:hypothetical protein